VKEFRDHILSFDDLRRDWPLPGRLMLRGFTYENRPKNDPAALVGWIETQGVDGSAINVGAYDVAIQAMLREGEIQDSNYIGRERELRLLRQEKNWLVKIVRAGFHYGAHSGYNVSRSFTVLFMAFLLSWLFAALTFYFGGIFPAKTEIVMNPCFAIKTVCPDGWMIYTDRFRIPVNYPKFDSLGYAADVFFPGLTFGFEEEWQPSPNWAIWCINLIRLTGILVIAMVALTLSGLVKRK
jgi:hypothetical protein